MAKLILTLDGVVLKEFTLTKERTTIGRKGHNDVPIDNLAVSGEHAAIVTILNDSFLEDLGSTNGTLVNGQPIKKHFLQNGDVIEVGKYKLKYLNEAVSNTTAADFEKTMVLRAPPKSTVEPGAGDSLTATGGLSGTSTGIGTGTGGMTRSLTDTQIGAASTPLPSMTSTNTSMPVPPPPAPVSPFSTLPPAASSPAAAPSAPIPPAPAPTPTPAVTGTTIGVIQILSGPNAGKELALTKALTTLGKPGVQVAVIAKRPQGFFITHVEGANFPVVNGKALDAQAHMLNDHDVIELAGVKMEFFYRPAV